MAREDQEKQSAWGGVSGSRMDGGNGESRMDGECPRGKECIGRAADQGSAGEWKDSWMCLTSGNLSLVGL